MIICLNFFSQQHFFTSISFQQTFKIFQPVSTFNVHLHTSGKAIAFLPTQYAPAPMYQFTLNPTDYIRPPQQLHPTGSELLH